MTDHAALSRDLALALGYYPESVAVKWEHLRVYRSWSEADPRPVWFKFDYRDPTVCLPLIEWLMREHAAMVSCTQVRRQRFVLWLGTNFRPEVVSGTLPEAVARAVIAVKKGSA